jgi:hypothetical protein
MATVVVGAILVSSTRSLRAQQPDRPATVATSSFSPSARACPDHGALLQELPAQLREKARPVLEKPTLATHGVDEVFPCNPLVYYWLLDHPDLAVPMWRRLGAQCMAIADRGAGWFGWTDGRDSEVHWQTVQQTPHLRVWYAEGNVRPASMLPLVPLRAVVVLHFTEGQDARGRALIRHQADMFLYTDSKTAVWVARLLGPTAPRLAQQCVTQMQMFFSALAWYLDRDPERADKLVAGSLAPGAPLATELRRLLACPPVPEKAVWTLKFREPS